MEVVHQESISSIHFAEDQQLLTKSLLNIVGIVTKKSAIEHLSHVKIDVQKKYIELTTTDTEVSIVEKIFSDKVTKCGIIAVDAIKLCEIVKKMPNHAEIDIKSCGQNIAISSGRIEFLLPSLNADNFPLVTEEEEQCKLEFSDEEIKFLLEKVKFAISTESARQSLNGIYIESDKDKITSAATDIHRLAVAEINKKVEREFSFIISKKTVNEILKIANTCKKLSLFLYGDKYTTRIKACNDKTKLISKLVAGTFPAFKNAIPQNFQFNLTLNKKEIIKSIERVTTVSHEQSRAIKFDIMANEIHLDVTSPDSSSAKEVIEITSNIKEKIEIYFNYVYLLDALSAVEDDEVIILLNSSSSPVMFNDNKNPQTTYVTMPMMP